MGTTLASILLPQIDELILRYEELRKKSTDGDCWDIEKDEATEFLTAAIAAIHRAAGADSPFAAQAAEAIERITIPSVGGRIPYVGGALKALRHAIDSGYLIQAQEFIHADIFADFLDMAQYLLSERYKDAAAVIIRGVLEEHLRKLCVKNKIAIDFTHSKGDVKPKKAETMNADLVAARVYSKGDQKNVTAWYDLGTKAAHGLYGEYTQQQVDLLLQSVRDFITRCPA